MATPPDHAQPTLRGEDSPSSYVDDDPNVITAEKAGTIAYGFTETVSRIERQILAQVSSGDLNGLTESIHRGRRYDALADLWNHYNEHGAASAAMTAGRMVYLAVERSEIDLARLEAARAFLADVHEQHTAHAQVLRCITHGIA